MTLDDIPKLFGAGEESGDAPASERMTRFSHNVASRETVEYFLAAPAHGHYVLTGQPKSFQLALD